MKINRNNYEAYLLDLLEGRLSGEEQQMVRDFLLLNPDCAGPVSDLEAWVLGQREVCFPDREKLKKTLPEADSELTDASFDLFSIARLENDLSPEQERVHEKMVTNDRMKRREWNLWQRTKLAPPRVLFPGKKRLKKRKEISRPVIWMSVISAAAVIALLITLLKTDQGTINAPEPRPMKESALLESHPDKGVVGEDELQQETPVVIQESEKLANEPVTLSIKKNPDPPELTGLEAGKKHSGRSTEGRLPQTESRDTITHTGSQSNLPERIRMAGLYHTNLHILDQGTYDRITPLQLPPGSIHMTSLSLAQLSSIDLQQLFEEFTRENEISIWSLANSGIKGINRITGADISFLAHKDEEGDVSGVQFRSRRFSLSTPLNREE